MRGLPNLTYWLFGGYIAWLLVSGNYKQMLALVDTSGWSASAAGSASAAKSGANPAANAGKVLPPNSAAPVLSKGLLGNL